MKTTDALVKDVLGGNMQSFEVLYNETSKKIYYVCYSFVKNEHDAMDLMQEVYLSALTHLSSLKEPERFTQWISQIAVNKCKDFLTKKVPVLLEGEEMNNIPVNDEELSLPEKYIIDREKRKILMNIMLEKLSAIQYQTVVLYYFNGLSQQEIATCMECPEGTVSYRLSVAREKIKAGVLEYEKKSGEKLYCVAGIPFLAAFFAAEADAMVIPNVFAAIMSGFVPSAEASAAAAATEATGAGAGKVAGAVASETAAKAAEVAVKAAAKTGIKAFFRSAVVKVAAVVLGLAVVGGLVFWISEAVKDGKEAEVKTEKVSKGGEGKSSDTEDEKDYEDRKDDEDAVISEAPANPEVEEKNIVEEAEDKMEVAKKQIVDFFISIGSMFPVGSEVYDAGNSVSQVFYYYDNILINPSWATEDIRFNAMISGGNEVYTENGWTPPHFASGETLYLADVIMYLPYYLAECSNNGKTPSIDIMLDEMCALNRNETFMANLRSSVNTDGNPKNEIYMDYEYAYASNYVPFYEALTSMCVVYDSLSEVSGHEFVFLTSKKVDADYYSVSDMTCTYVIPFYDKTANLNGEAMFDAENNLIGISFSEEDIEAMKIVAKAENFSENNNFSIKYYEDNTEEFFMVQADSESYSFIVDVLDEKTGAAQEQVVELYKALELLFSDDADIVKNVFRFYRNVYTDEVLAYQNDFDLTGVKYADGEEITIRHLYTYIPYYLSETLGGTVESYSVNDILGEMSLQNRTESMLGFVDDYNYNNTVNVVPFMQTLGHLAYSYETFSGFSEHKIMFSAPIYVDEEWKWYEHFYGKESVAYVIPVYDKTGDVYSIAFFNEDNELVNMQVGY